MTRIAFAVVFSIAALAADERGVMQANLYTGVAVDRFAALELANYLNPGASDRDAARGVLGFEFEYRLSGDTHGPVAANFWLFGRTAHGVQSGEIDCRKAALVPVCPQAPEWTRSGLLSRQTLYMLRQASTLEGTVGVRWELFGFQRHSRNPASLYVSARIGFVSQKNNGGDIANTAQYSVGLMVTGGGFRGSYLEAGYGRSDLFLVHPGRRVKFDAYLRRRLLVFRKSGLAPALFVQFLVDSDFGRGADTVQTIAGLVFDLS